MTTPPHGASDGSRTREGRRLDLDVVRGLAIVLALGWHFSGERTGTVVLDALTWPGRSFGWAGVDLFFVLSGFLLGRLVLHEQARTGRFDGRRFTARRLLKLWPVLYVFLAVQALAGPEPWTGYLWQNALHVQNYAGTSLSHLWSLAVEEHYYLALAVLFPLLARRRGSPRLLAAILVAVLVGALALRIWGATAGVSDVRLQWRRHFRVDSITAGVLLALVSVHWPERFERLRRHRRLLVGVLVAGTVHLLTVGKQGALGATVGFTVAYLTAAALLLLVYRAAWVPRARWISVPTASWAGTRTASTSGTSAPRPSRSPCSRAGRRGPCARPRGRLVPPQLEGGRRVGSGRSPVDGGEPETPVPRQPGDAVGHRRWHLAVHQRERDQHPPVRRQHSCDDVPLGRRRRPERPHVERDDDVERLLREVGVRERRGQEPHPALLHGGAVPPGRGGDHRRRSVDADDDARGEPLGEQRREDAVPAADLQDPLPGGRRDEIRCPAEALGVAHA